MGKLSEISICYRWRLSDYPRNNYYSTVVQSKRSHTATAITWLLT